MKISAFYDQLNKFWINFLLFTFSKLNYEKKNVHETMWIRRIHWLNYHLNLLNISRECFPSTKSRNIKKNDTTLLFCYPILDNLVRLFLWSAWLKSDFLSAKYMLSFSTLWFFFMIDHIRIHTYILIYICTLTPLYSTSRVRRGASGILPHSVFFQIVSHMWTNFRLIFSSAPKLWWILLHNNILNLIKLQQSTTSDILSFIFIGISSQWFVKN